ncbi:hypothetical protein SCLCIDRAFT_25569 [Scleroderma citrinum Foug A]|uniref:Uncharacterized protein n=1 Tax=Scleroderma citrinum Foug A TaxID=1036808 RepID=A0A0C3DZV2_9AGAM|nr:hypothetical protein SCLCIDRAFT_25569 [Scleroderma citrinum Foug A]
MSLNPAAKRVCEGAASLPPSSFERNAMCHFLNLLIETKPIPHSLRDLQDGSLLEQYKQGIVIVECHLGKYYSHSGTIFRRKYYLIRPRPASSTLARGRFTIFINDPIAVMHVICQQWGPHMSNIASQLVAAGIPFSMCILDPAVPVKPVKFCTSALGYLPFDYQLTAGDYTAYLDRAALMKGGIVGWLAQEALGEHADMVIRCSPSNNVLQMGTAIQLGESYYWDDDLVEDEEQLICGVYKMSTGQRHVNGEQIADVSWWPKQSTWEGSGLDVGYWSSDDEAWYQKRLELIRNCGTDSQHLCMNATQWRNTLKYYKETTRTVAANRQSAEVWLDNALRT